MHKGNTLVRDEESTKSIPTALPSDDVRGGGGVRTECGVTKGVDGSVVDGSHFLWGTY